MDKNITIFGAGYVGLTTAVILANCGYDVNLVEVNKSRLDVLLQGKSFFYEEGINELLKNALENKTIRITDNPDEALSKSTIAFCCVGTPDNPDGSSNLSYVFSVAETVADKAPDELVFVQKSTVPVGTGERIEKLFSEKNRNLHYVSNPEFLREGTAVLDTLWFDRIVVGGNNSRANSRVMDLYKSIEKNREELTRISSIGAPEKTPLSQYFDTNRNSAELIKVTANAFLALKISFANSIAKLADKTGADVVEVMDAVGADNRIGRAFLYAGRGYGGGCFPKDVSGLIASASEHGVEMPIMTAATDVNESMPGYIANKLQDELENLIGKSVAVLGLSFKAGTSDARKSPGVKIANLLQKAGATIRVHDPHALEEAKEDLQSSITLCDSLFEATKYADAVVFATDWQEYKIIDISQLGCATNAIVVDAMNMFNQKDIEAASLRYIGVGR